MRVLVDVFVFAVVVIVLHICGKNIGIPNACDGKWVIDIILKQLFTEVGVISMSSPCHVSGFSVEGNFPRFASTKI